jgi:hypothetical protein
VVHEASLATDEGFIHFNRRTVAAELHKRLCLHCETNAVQHEPSRLLSHTERPTDLVGTDSVLAVGNHPNGEQPLVERKRRILKDSPDLGRELSFGVDALALPLALILEEHDIFASAGGAGNDTVRPTDLNHKAQAVVGIGEVDHGLLEGLWFGVHVVPHKPNITKGGLIRQVYYCRRKNVILRGLGSLGRADELISLLITIICSDALLR